jgi:hypothetical protein
MANSIEIHRPSEFHADENAPRTKIYEAVIPQLRDKEYFGAGIAEQMFHTLNAPEDMLNEVELEIANDFRAKKHYSLSTGDIVVVDGVGFLCQSVGWKEVTI